MSKINYKNYPVDNTEKALEVLGDLIINVIYDLNLHLKYHNELRELAIKYFDKADETERKSYNIKIPTEEYFNIKDKILYRQMSLLRSLADDQKTSFSYKNFRKFLKDKGFLSGNLPEEIGKHLNEVLRLRNWTFHNTQSNYTAKQEVAQNEALPFCEVRHIFNPIIILNYSYIDIKELMNYDDVLEIREDIYTSILEYMKKDYETMYKLIPEYNKGNEVIFTPGESELIKKDGPVQYLMKTIDGTRDFMGASSKAVQLSMAIQNSQYDGSKEKYNNILSFFSESK